MTPDRPARSKLNSRHRVWAISAGAVVALLGLAGCQTADLRGAYSAHDAGDFEYAAAQAEQLRPLVGPDGIVEDRPYEPWDELWVSLERGKVLQDAGRFGASADAFEVAAKVLRGQKYAPEVSLAGAFNNIQAILSDERKLDYQASFYDPILIETAQALNHAMMGDLESAAVFARRQIERQEEIADRRAAVGDVFARYNDLASTRGSGAIESDDAFRRERNRLTRGLDPEFAGPEAWEAPVPYGFYIGSILMRAADRPAEAIEFERRFEAFRPNSALRAGRGGIDGRVFVLFENGLPPDRVSGEREFGIVGSVVPLPVLRDRYQRRARGLVVSGGAKQTEAELLGRVDALVQLDFQERLGLIWGRPILATILKAAATETTAQLTTEPDDLLRLIIRGVGFLWVATAEADTRMWRTLPGEHLAAELDRPASGVIDLELIGPDGRGAARRTIELPGEGAVLVWCRSTNAGNLEVYTVPLD